MLLLGINSPLLLSRAPYLVIPASPDMEPPALLVLVEWVLLLVLVDFLPRHLVPQDLVPLRVCPATSMRSSHSTLLLLLLRLRLLLPATPRLHHPVISRPRRLPEPNCVGT